MFAVGVRLYFCGGFLHELAVRCAAFVDFLRKMANYNYGFWLLVFTEFAHATTIAY